jgi:hypothetical protein
MHTAALYRAIARIEFNTTIIKKRYLHPLISLWNNSPLWMGNILKI